MSPPRSCGAEPVRAPFNVSPARASGPPRFRALDARWDIAARCPYQNRGAVLVGMARGAVPAAVAAEPFRVPFHVLALSVCTQAARALGPPRFRALDARGDTAARCPYQKNRDASRRERA